MDYLQHIWRQLTRRRTDSFEAELEEELRGHIQLQTERNVRLGMTDDHANREAMRQFGGLEQIREQVRDTTGQVWLKDLFRDTRFAARVLVRSPGFALTAILVLGLAIGLATTIFSFVQAILLRPLPYFEADRLVVIRTVSPSREFSTYGVSWLDLEDWRAEASSFAGIAAYRLADCDLTDGRSTQRVQGLRVTSNFFEVVGLPLELGRTFSEEEQTTRAQCLLLSNGLWLERFGGDPNVVGLTQDVYSWARFPTVGISGWQIVGVAGREFRFPPVVVEPVGRRLGINQPVEFFAPVWRFDRDDRAERYELTAIARLKPDASVEQARSEMEAISRRLEEAWPETNQAWTAEVVPLNDLVTAEIRPALLLLAAAACILLLMACTNVASLLIARSIARQQELAVRAALGAGRWRLVRQLVTESILLSLASGAVGVILSVWGVAIVRGLVPADVPRLRDVSVNLTVLIFAVILSLATGLVVGILPSVLATQTDLSDSLKSGGRGKTTVRSRKRLMSGLVALESGVAVVLLAASVIVIRSFAATLQVDPGFQSDRLLTMTVSLPQAKYEWKHNSEFCVELVTKLRSVPGVESASAVRGLPTKETKFDANLYIEGRPDLPKHERPQARIRVIEPDFFETMKIPLIEGRLFEPADSVGTIGYSPSVICNETMALRFWPGESAIGKRFCVIKPGEDPMEIVGVVGDVRFTGLKVEPFAEVYYPEALFPQAEFTLLVRTEANPEAMLSTVERLVRNAEPDVVISDAATMAEVVFNSLSRERFLVVLLTVFSIGALILSLTGHYGVVAYSVSQRQQEIGIRLALGAQPGQIVRKLVLDGMLITTAGLAAGAGVSVLSARALESQVYGVRASDPWTLAGTILVILVASVLGCFLPAVRSCQLPPASVLRS